MKCKTARKEPETRTLTEQQKLDAARIILGRDPEPGETFEVVKVIK
ncbi:MAG: hypothetical protein JNK57_16530 [Planctomycetaceae bacterium]|nr:hypothetical protein [Planctomycetaceae bacterium]